MELIQKLLFIFSLFSASVLSLKLKQVTIVSRHSLRTPLTLQYEKFTPNKWVTPIGEIGHLTSKGALLERHMGAYFAEWLKKEGLFTNDCPTNEEVHIYSNSIQRTIESAKSFVDTAFSNCDVAVHHQNIAGWDTMFSYRLQNTTKEFVAFIVNEVQRKADKWNLSKNVLLLEKILDFNNSYTCKTQNICDVFRKRNIAFYDENQQLYCQVDTDGPAITGYNVVDALMSAYYDGYSIENVTWGGITSEEEWKSLQDIREYGLNLRFGIKKVAMVLGKPLMDYIKESLLNESNKFSIIFGHDSTVLTVIKTLDFKDYHLHDQYEKIPVGGKVVFQKWYDEVNDQDLVRIYYVYQSTKQLRDAEKLTLENPPQWVLLELKDCKIDEHGFCQWNDFISVLNRI